MRKRLQRLRDKLRREKESEQREIRAEQIHPDFPARIVDLLARPQLTDLPENPVGSVLDLLRTVYADFTEVTLPEVVDFAEARKTIGEVALYIDPLELHRVDETRILRYDLTLPLLSDTSDGEKLPGRPDIHDPIRQRRCGHQQVAHRVGGDVSERGSCRNDHDVAIFARQIDPVIGGDG